MRRQDLKKRSIGQLVDLFEKIALEQDRALLDDEIPKYNRLYEQQSAIEDELRLRGADAARALVGLYRHPNVQVRLISAQRTRDLAPTLAREVFEGIVASQRFPQAAHAAGSLRNLDLGLPIRREERFRRV